MSEVELKGHGFERANICANCRQPLGNPRDGHYHSHVARSGVGAEPWCCFCKCAEHVKESTSFREIPELSALESEDVELLERVLKAVEGLDHFKVGDVWKALGAETDSLWYDIRGLFRSSGRFEQISKRCWKVRI